MFLGRWCASVRMTDYAMSPYSAIHISYEDGCYTIPSGVSHSEMINRCFATYQDSPATTELSRKDVDAELRLALLQIIHNHVRRPLAYQFYWVERDNFIEYRGYTYRRSNTGGQELKQMRSSYRKLGLLVAKAIRQASDEGEADSRLRMDICEAGNDIYRDAVRSRIAAVVPGITLASCGHMELDEDLHDVADGNGRLRDTACNSCYEDSDVVVYCVDDGNHHWRDNVYYWDSDDEYHLREEEDDESDSDDDPNRRLDYGVDVMRFLCKDMSFKSSAHGDFHMGIELETAAKDYDTLHSKVIEVRRELGEEYLVCKYDGSVGEYSLEWVTRPTSLKDHIEKLGGWQSTTGLVAWNNRACGMHVHIDSQAFTALTLGKMIQFYNSEANTDFIRAIAGRHPRRDNQAEEYAALDSSSVLASPKAALKGKDPSRYRMINCENLSYSESKRLGLDSRHGESNTVEIRIFRASLKKERLLAQVEFAHAVVMFCRVTSYRDLTQASFLKWLKVSAGLYPNLAKWFNINHRHGSTVTNTDPIAKAAQGSQPELFAQAA